MGAYAADSVDTINGANLSYPIGVDTIVITLSEAGSINITENKNTTVSGNFNLSMIGGKLLTGSFSNMPIQ